LSVKTDKSVSYVSSVKVYIYVVFVNASFSNLACDGRLVCVYCRRGLDILITTWLTTRQISTASWCAWLRWASSAFRI